MSDPIMPETVAVIVAGADAAALLTIFHARVQEFSQLVNSGVARETDTPRQKAHVALDQYLDNILVHGNALLAAQEKLKKMQAAAMQGQTGSANPGTGNQQG